MAEVTITIDTETWRMLKNELDMFTSGIGDLRHAIERGEREPALEQARRAQFAVRTLDRIGWTEPATELTEVTVDGDFRNWLKNVRRDTLTMVGELNVTLRRQQAGEERWFYCESNQDESVSLTRTYVDRGLQVVKLIDALLAQFDQVEVVA